MEYQRQTYLPDKESDEIGGIVILDTDESAGYRVTENQEHGWSKPFWIPENHINRVKYDSPKNLSSDQYLRICEVVGLSA